MRRAAFTCDPCYSRYRRGYGDFGLLIDPLSNLRRGAAVELTHAQPTQAQPDTVLTAQPDTGEGYQTSWLDRNRTLLYVAGGMVAFGALFLFFKRKSGGVAGYRRRRNHRG